jgi:Fe(3+) dicitrate transport protein
MTLLSSLLISPVALGAEEDAAAMQADGGVAPADGGVAPADTGAAPHDAGADAVPVAPPAAAAPIEPLPLPPALPPALEAPRAESPERLEPLTVVGTRESRTAGSAHVLRPRDLERMDYDNAETVIKQVPGVYARGEDGFGLRPNIGIRGVSPDRSKKLTLMEDGILFGPAPYSAPAAYYFPMITHMEMVRVIKGPGAVSFGPNTVGGAIDLVTRGIPANENGAIDLSAGAHGYGKMHAFYGASTARAGYVLEGVHFRTDGFKKIDGTGAADTGFEKNEWMWKGRYLLSTDPSFAQQVGLKLGYADEDSRESYLGLTDSDLRANPNRRYRASLFDRMQWHRTQIVASYQAKIRGGFTVNAAVYRNDFHRTWRKVNRIGRFNIADVLANPNTATNQILYDVLTGASDTSSSDEIIYIGPNQRQFVSQGAQVIASWHGESGPVAHRVEGGVRYHYDRIDRLHTENGFRMTAGNLVYDNGPTITTANNRHWANALAMHLTDAATWGPLTLTPGVRVELINTVARDRVDGTEVEGTPQRVVIPGIGAYAQLAPMFGVLAGAYRGFSPAAPGQPVKPETSVNYDAGFRFTPPRTRLEAIGFFNDYQNLTSICTFASGCGPGAEGMQTDVGKAHIYGAELFGRAEAVVRPGFVIPLMASYTYTRTKVLQTFMSNEPSLEGAMAGDELPFVPRHQASASAAFETPRGSLAVAGSYISAMRERVGPPGQPSTPSEPLTDPSFVLDATARVFVTAAGHVYLSVRNVLGAEDIASRVPYGARPIAPRWILVGTKWSF